jgi:hypothetical protein
MAGPNFEPDMNRPMARPRCAPRKLKRIQRMLAGCMTASPSPSSMRIRNRLEKPVVSAVSGGQQAPDHEADRQGAFGAVAVDQPAGRNLQGGVAPEEGGVDQAAVGVAELEEGLEVRGR